jgi:valyl-tRNA synthetase
VENIQDWCISRQIWWGHRLPVYYCKNCQNQASESMANGQWPMVKGKAIDHRLSTIDQKGIIVSRLRPEKCPACGSMDIYQDEDVLDTWFSSWLWPFAALYWPKKEISPKGTFPKEDLAYFYPTSALVTAPEIIFFWVARMIMAGFEFQKKIPFKDVYIHGTVRDASGKKMSKSLGNSIDPLEIIDEYGTDALRFSLISITAQGQDVFLSKDRFEQGRNFANKIWNASRFIQMNLDTEKLNYDLCIFFKENELSLSNRWILSRFYSSLEDVEKYLNNYQFNEAVNTLYSFFWHEFCDWYLEIIKTDIKNLHNQLVMYKILEKFLRALHPFMPFITEEIWQKIPHDGKSIMVSTWPHIQKQIINKKTEETLTLIFGVITTIRNMRLELEIPVQSQNIKVKISASNKDIRFLLEANSKHIKNLAKINDLFVETEYKQSKGEFTNIFKGMHIAIPLEGVIEIEKHKQKLQDKITKTLLDIKSKETMLSNENFIKRAPVEVIDAEKDKLIALNEEVKKLKEVKDGIS